MNTRFAIVNPEDLQIYGTYMSEVSLFDGQKGSWPHIQMPGNIDVTVAMCIKDDEGNLMFVEDEEKKAVITATRFTELRKERNRRLAETDWVVLPDVQMDEVTKNQWLSYRQALRDLPNTISNIDNVVWPQSP
jgi:hypothetical protein